MNSQSIINSDQPASDLPDYILFRFDTLQPGNGFIINEDNDPHSIYDQMLKEKGDSFSWEYLNVGPKKWCIKISKRDKNNDTETLGEMALSDHRKALVLRKYGLDFSFKGNRTLGEACAERDISTRNVERDLEACAQQPLVYTVNYSSWELDYLADFIITNHHQYTRKSLTCIAEELEKNRQLIYESYPNLLPLIAVFNELRSTMQFIIQEEEQVLFPCIRFLSQVAKGKIVANTLLPGSVQDLIRKIGSEHQKVGEQINYICNFTRNYTLPVIEAAFYNQVLQQLREFDNDLHQHVHIESNILFRKALKLEQEYLAHAAASNSNPATNKSANDHLSSLL